MKMRFAVAAWFCCLAVSAQAQRVFSAEEFIQQVKLYHPVARQANILVERAASELMASRGSFDPVMALDASRKTFDGKNYYFYTNPELKIPTRIGVDLKAGLENNGGEYINPENTLGQSSYLGVEVPLGKGLLMDGRRAALQQAKILQNQSQQARLNAINDLLFDAYAAYWQWAGMYSLYRLYNQYLQVASERYRLVKIAFQQGDRSSMDTLEALTQVQSFYVLQSEAIVKLNDAAIELSNYLWQENDTAYTLPATYLPDTVQFSIVQPPAGVEALIAAASQNPLLRSYVYKLDSLEVERRLKFQSLLPVVNAKANLLNKGYYVFKGVESGYLENNYKWGVDIKLPLFLREGRGDYRQAKLKIAETNYAFLAKRWEIENKVRSYYNQVTQLRTQVQTLQSMFGNYTGLLQQENLKFRNGESSLFLLNTRENKVIETAQKLVELKIKYQKSYYAVLWSAGLLR